MDSADNRSPKRKSAAKKVQLEMSKVNESFSSYDHHNNKHSYSPSNRTKKAHSHTHQKM